MARTTRIPNTHASAGAVRQSSGTLPVYRCNTCHGEVVWAESKRTGRRYLANVSRGYHDQRYYVGADVHDCAPRLAMADDLRQQGEAIALNERYVLAVQAAVREGDTVERDRLMAEWAEVMA